MEKRALSEPGIDWSQAKQFPTLIDLPNGEEAFRKKFGVWQEDGSTIAFYEHIEDDRYNGRKTITTYQYAMIDGEPFMIEQFEPRHIDD